jgi:hypothetical protein
MSSQYQPQSAPSRGRIIEAINAPLGFYVLALLIVEAFLGSVVIGGNLEQRDKMTGIWIGVVMFIVVILMVFILAWFKPENITFDREAHLRARELTPPPEPGPGPKRKVPRPKRKAAPASPEEREHES